MFFDRFLAYNTFQIDWLPPLIYIVACFDVFTFRFSVGVLEFAWSSICLNLLTNLWRLVLHIAVGDRDRCERCDMPLTRLLFRRSCDARDSLLTKTTLG